MRVGLAIGLVAVMVGSGVRAASAQDTCTLHDDQMKAMVQTARAAHPTDTKAFIAALDDAVKTATGARKISRFEAVALESIEGTNVYVFAPYGTFRNSLEEAIRKMEPIESVKWQPYYGVVVDPPRIDSPDIEKIVVQRDGQTVEPAENKLEVLPLVTRMGAQRPMHQGHVSYSCAAFAPGAVVTVTAIPTIGRNITRTLKSDALATLK